MRIIKNIIAMFLMSYWMPLHAADGAHIGPLISGTTSYVAGEWVWTDYAYDDRGANSDTTTGGDASYPEGQSNSADIIQMQVALLSGSLKFTVVLQTLIDDAVPEIGVMIDTDSNLATGTQEFPGSGWTVSGTLGSEWFVVATKNGAKLSRWKNEMFEDVSTLPVLIDSEANTVSFEVPFSILNPDRSTWRLYSWSGLAASSTATDGDIYDLAFVVGELITDRNSMIIDSAQGAFVTGGTTLWQDQRQSAILAGELDASYAAASIDFARLSEGENDVATATDPGWYTFLHHSSLKLAEGVEQGESLIGVGNAFTTRRYLGPYQPYLVLNRADSTQEKHPLVVFLHGASQTHLQNTYWYEPAEANNTFNYAAITIFPLARGEVLSYNGIAEYDVLEVMADAMERLPVDEDRVVLTGFSMGGMGTYKLASLYPDRFSTAIAHFGNAQSNGVTQLMENLLNLPFRADNGMIDYLVQPTSFLPDRDRGIELGYDFRFFDVSNAHHALQPHLSNCLLLEAIQRKRVKDPARIQYSIEADRLIDDPETGLRLLYDGAYWLSDIALRNGVEYGSVYVENLARTDRQTGVELVDKYNDSMMRDYCGTREDNMPSPAAGFHWRERSLVHTPATAAMRVNGLALDITGVQALTLDLDRESLDLSKPLTLITQGDGLTNLTLRGSFSGHYALREGGVLVGEYTADESGDLRLSEEFSGDRTLLLTRIEVDNDDEAEPPHPPNPAPVQPRSSSGGGSASIGFLVLLLAILFIAYSDRQRL